MEFASNNQFPAQRFPISSQANFSVWDNANERLSRPTKTFLEDITLYPTPGEHISINVAVLDELLTEKTASVIGTGPCIRDVLQSSQGCVDCSKGRVKLPIAAYVVLVVFLTVLTCLVMFYYNIGASPILVCCSSISSTIYYFTREVSTD